MDWLAMIFTVGLFAWIIGALINREHATFKSLEFWVYVGFVWVLVCSAFYLYSLPTTTTERVAITNRYNNIEFSKPVKITETKTTYPFTLMRNTLSVVVNTESEDMNK